MSVNASKLMCLAVMAFFTLSADAIPGRLNSAGCHKSKKAGYHCHRAQPSNKKVTK
jgi:hypothetical protein